MLTRRGVAPLQRMLPSLMWRGSSNRFRDLTPDEANKEYEIAQRKRVHQKPYVVGNGGVHILYDPLLNKGTAFPHSERERMMIRGMVAPTYTTPADQDRRIMRQLSMITDPLAKYSFMSALQDRNEVLFYRILMQNIKELAPIIYTPTVGLVCEKFGDIFRRPRGMYFSSQDRHEFSSMIYNWPYKDVDVIVVTDGSRILGLGDLGAHGMGIPIGKLSLYIAGGGIHPARTLPILLDAGTNNPRLLNDRLYLGVQEKRLSGEAYYSLVDEFMTAVKFRFPNALVQFEDFENRHARRLLEKYRDTHCCFNDDIQGTGATALAGILCALRILKLHPRDLIKQRIVVLGAGSAGLGVVDSLIGGMMAEGFTIDEARKAFYLVDIGGLIGHNRKDIQEIQRPLARFDVPDGISLHELVKRVKPTILLGLSGVGNAFTEDVVRSMAAGTDRPIIFPMSNPSSKAECTPGDAIKWTDGRAILATGSPFQPVVYNGKEYHFSQANNMFIFPGVGLGAVVVRSRTITDKMFYEASKALAVSVTEEDLALGKVYPDIEEIRVTSESIANAVGKVAIEENLHRNKDVHLGNLAAAVKATMWEPVYVPLVEDAHRRKTFR